MDNVIIKFKKTHELAVIPSANIATNGTGDSGSDLVAVDSVHIPARESRVVPVGLTLAFLTPGFWLRIEPRSGLGFKHSIQPHLGVIDNGYRGDLGVKLYNFSNHDDYRVKSGDKIAQLVVYKLYQPVCGESDVVTETDRGDKGFGSSDNSGLPPLRARVRDVTRPPFTITQEADDWFYKNTYQIDEGGPSLPNFESAYDLYEYAKKTDMPDNIFADFLRNKVWERNR